jgi:hypothetical protein
MNASYAKMSEELHRNMLKITCIIWHLNFINSYSLASGYKT